MKFWLEHGIAIADPTPNNIGVTCPFCLRAGVPMTREHVFARWLVQKVRGSRLVPSRANAAEGADTRISRVFATVCADCNAGWMSGLEVSFRRIVFARPRAGLLPAPDRATLSRWFTKTAVLLADADAIEFLSPTQRAQLVGGMPEEIEVFIARRRRPSQHLDFALDVVGAGTSARRVRLAAVLVDDLVAHVARREVLASRHGTRLWPLRTHALRWETMPVISGLA